MQLNASQIEVLQVQDSVINAMKDAALKELLNVSCDHDVYMSLLKDLIWYAEMLTSEMYDPYTRTTGAWK